MLVSAADQREIYIHTHTHTYIYLPLATLSHPLPSLTHLGHHRAENWAPLVVWQLPIRFLCCTWPCIYVKASCSINPTLSFLDYFNKFLLYICSSIPALKISSSVSFLWVPHISIKIWYFLLSFRTDFTLYDNSRSIFLQITPILFLFVAA